MPQTSVADSLFRHPVDAAQRNGVRDLVSLREYRPLLGEQEIDGPLGIAAMFPGGDQIEDVLDDARLLIVGFLDQERVVANRFFFLASAFSGGSSCERTNAGLASINNAKSDSATTDCR